MDKAKPGVVAELDEAQLGAAIERAKAGDSQAWNALYRQFYDRIFRHIAYMTHKVSLAEDLAQEVFVQAMNSMSSFEGSAKFSTWLFAIANRTVYKHWRKSGRQAKAYERLSCDAGHDPQDGPDTRHQSQQQAQALKAALTRLPDNLREAFILVDVQQLDAAQAAQRLGITKGNLAVRATRARAKIREVLEEDG